MKKKIDFSWNFENWRELGRCKFHFLFKWKKTKLIQISSFLGFSPSNIILILFVVFFSFATFILIFFFAISSFKNKLVENYTSLLNSSLGFHGSQVLAIRRSLGGSLDVFSIFFRLMFPYFVSFFRVFPCYFLWFAFYWISLRFMTKITFSKVNAVCVLLNRCQQ